MKDRRYVVEWVRPDPMSRGGEAQSEVFYSRDQAIACAKHVAAEDIHGCAYVRTQNLVWHYNNYRWEGVGVAEEVVYGK